MPYVDASLPRRVRRQMSVLLALVLTSAALVVLSAGRADAAPNPNEYVAVAAGGVQTSEGAHSLGLTRDGRVMAWGWNLVGQLGDGTTVDRTRPVEVQGLPADDPVTQIAAGALFSMALTESGRLFTWGQNSNGQLGIGSFTVGSTTPVQVVNWRTGVSASGTQDSLTGGTLETLPAITQISAGAVTAYARGSDGYAYAWGSTGAGQLGAGVDAFNSLSQQSRHLPRRMSTALRTPLTDVAEVEAGDRFALVRRTDGSIWFAGENSSGEAGDGTSGLQSRRNFLTRITALDGKGIVDLAAGMTNGYARTGSGQVYSWGSFSEGQLCRINNNTHLTPNLTTASGVARMVAGYRNVVFLDGDGLARGCGSNVRSSLTLPAETDYVMSLTRLPNLDGVRALDLSYLYGVAVSPAGDLNAWGYNNSGQVGNGTTIEVPLPMEIAGISGATSVVAGARDSFAIVAGGQVKAWGQNKYGSLGIGTTAVTPTPTTVPGLSNVVQVSSGMPNRTETNFYPGGGSSTPDTENQHHTLALTAGGDVYAWGANHYRQLGDGTTVDRTTPVPVDIPGTVVQIAAGGTHSLALNSSGEVYAWGYTNRGQVGTGASGSLTTVATPTKLDLPAIAEIAAGAIDSFARTAAGAVYGWGYNFQGRAGTGGDGDCLNQPNPCIVAVPTPMAQTYQGTPWTAVSLAVGGDFGTAVAADGSAYGWGLTFNGAYYQTTNLRAYYVPRPADVINPVLPLAQLSGGGGHMLARDADGGVLAWGANNFNQVGGVGDRVLGESLPVEISLPGPATDVSAGDLHSLAIVGGKVYGWGYIGKGTLGVDWGEEVRTVQTIATPARLTVTGATDPGAQHYRRADQTLFVNPAASGSFTLRYGRPDDSPITGVTFPALGAGWTGGGAGTLNGDWYEKAYSFGAGASGGTHAVVAQGGPATDLTVVADGTAPYGGGIGYPTSTTSPIATVTVKPAEDAASGMAGVSLESRRTPLTASGCAAGSWTSWATEVAAAAASNTRLIDEATCYEYRAVYRDRVGNTRVRTGPTLVSDARLAFGLDQPAGPASGAVTLTGFARQQFHTISTVKLTWNGPGSTTGTICENPPLAPSTGTFTCTWDTTALPDGAYTVGIYAASDVNGGSTSRSVTIQNGNQPPVKPPKQPTTPDKTAPVLTIAKPKCKPALKGKKCKAWLASAKAWRTVTGTAVDKSAVSKVEVLAYAKVGKKKFKTLSGGKLKTVKTKALATRTPVAARIVAGGWTISLPKLPQGKWTVQVRATDAAGNVSGWVTLKVKIKRR